MKLSSIKEIEPELSRCISVDSEDRLFAAGGLDGKSIITHNSVIQRNIIMGCILRPDHWRFIGIDLKRVELSAYRAYSNVVLGIATELDDALTVLRFAQTTMMKRYQEMESVGESNFLDMPNHGPALMVMIDEAGELLSPSGVKALVGSTLVQTPFGKRKLEDLQIGDTVYDINWTESKIEQKYTPEKQTKFEVKISKDSTKETESFIAGSEHYWVVYVNGEEKLLTTTELHQLHKHTPIEERKNIKFKRAKQAEITV